MDTKEAYQIVNKYGSLLEESANHTTTAYPKSILPYPKAKIQAALIICLLDSAGSNNPSTIMMQHLENSYLFLSSFIDDEDAEIIAKYDEQMPKLSKLGKHIRKEDVKNFSASCNLEKVVQINDKITEEMIRLNEQLQELREQFKIP